MPRSTTRSVRHLAPSQAAATRDRVQAPGDVVDPDAPHALAGGQRRHRVGGGVARRRPGRSTPVSGSASTDAEETLARRADEQRPTQGVELVEVGEQRPVVVAPAWRNRDPGRARRAPGRGRRRRRRRAGPTARRARRARRRRRPPSDSISALGPRQCMATYGTRSARRSRASAGRPVRPETSLTSIAPASTAASAVSARMVSMLTLTPAATSARTTGRTRACSSSTGTRSAPGRVDSPPTSTMSAPSAARIATASDGVLEGEETSPVGEGVRRHVEDAHDDGAPEVPQVVGQPGRLTGRRHDAEPTDDRGAAGLNARP